MSKTKIFFIVFGLLLVFLITTAAYQIYQKHALEDQENESKHQQMVAARHHLLCEVLKPGMSMDDVFKILHQAGDYTVSSGIDKSPDAQLHIVFLNPRERDLYGGSFELGFYDYKYHSAYIRGFDWYETICNFSQATP